MLLEAGADIEVHDEVNGATPLIVATEAQNLSVVSLLLEKGANIDAIDNVCVRVIPF